MNDSDKLENLRVLYQELHVSRRNSEAFQNRVAFAFSTMFLLFAGLIIKGDYNFENEDVAAAVISTALIICTAVVIGLAYVWTIWAVNKERYMMIVRVEQALGYHTQDVYITQQEINGFKEKPYAEATILPKRSLPWGENKSKYSYLRVNMLAITLSGIAAIAALFITHA